MTKIAFIWTGNTLGFTDPRDGEQYTVPNTHSNYTQIKEAVKAGDAETAVNLFNLKEQIAKQIEAQTSVGDIQINGNTVTFKGIPIENSITEMMLRDLEAGFDISRIANFLSKILENPSFSSREQLHGFIEKYLFDITDDGDFYAYKVINNDWTDCHTGSIDNSIGTKVTMPRKNVDENPDRTCSSGLHVCGRSYVNQFKHGNRRLVLVSVNPRDVVAVPRDYNDAKMRVCEYTVIGEVNGSFQQVEDGNTAGRVKKIQVRDAKGRFTSKMAFEPAPERELDRTW